MKTPKRPSPMSWQRISLLALCVVLTLVLTTLLLATTYIQHLLSFVTIDGDATYETVDPDVAATATEETDDDYDDSKPTNPTIDHDDVTIATLPSIPKEELIVDGVVNIMLIGEDRRPGEPRQRSDSMILCSFNLNNNSITMISFLRDTYVSIPGYASEKMNAAYAHGGPNLLDQTLATNFGVHVDANVMVDFDGFRSIIDMLGGVEINLTKKEANYMNEMHGFNLSAGLQRLNGYQALQYSRIRKIDSDSYRAQRQRNVLTALIKQYKSKSVLEMVTLTSKIVQTGFIQTDMTASELTSYVMQLAPMLSTAQINNQQIPASNTYTNADITNEKGKLVTDCKLIDLDTNRKILQKIFTAN